MRVTKTSEQAAAEEQARQAALEQTEVCPECGVHRIEVRERETGTYEERMIVYTVVKTEEGTVYHCKCINCGCEWDTNEWGDGAGDEEPSEQPEEPTFDDEDRDYAEAGRILLGVYDGEESQE